MRNILIAFALALAAYACGTYAADETYESVERVSFSTRGDGMQCVTVGDRTYCDSGCGR